MTMDNRTPGQKWYDARRQDPRWQRVKAEVMLAGGFKCQDCGDTGATLNVHHKEYVSGRDPWDYPKENFVCCCEKCHQLREEVAALSRRLFQNIHPETAMTFLRQLITCGAPVDEVVGQMAFCFAIVQKLKEGAGNA